MAAKLSDTETILMNICNMTCSRDFILVTEGRKFHVHWLVVAASSNHVKALGKPAINNSEFYVNHTDGATLEKIVNYFYCGRIQLTAQDIIAITITASELKIDRLRQKCANFWNANLTAANSVQLLLQAEKCGLSDFWNDTLDFISTQFEKIPTSDVLQIEDYQTLFALFNDEQLIAREAYIFEVLMQWVERNENDRAAHVPTLIECIQLKHMSTEFIIDTVEPFYRSHNCSIEPILSEYRKRSIQTDGEPLSFYRNISN